MVPHLPCLDSPCCYLSNKIGFTSFGVRMQKLSQFLFWCFCFLCTGRYYRVPSGTTGWTTAGSTAPSRKFSSFGTGFWGCIFPNTTGPSRYYRIIKSRQRRYYRTPRGSTMGCQVTVPVSKENCRPVLPGKTVKTAKRLVFGGTYLRGFLPQRFLSFSQARFSLSAPPLLILESLPLSQFLP